MESFEASKSESNESEKLSGLDIYSYEAMRAGKVPFGVRPPSPGHDGSYAVRFVGYDINNYVPREYEFRLQDSLNGDWHVENRGQRIEIFNKEYGKREDEYIVGTLKELFDPNAKE